MFKEQEILIIAGYPIQDPSYQALEYLDRIRLAQHRHYGGW